MGKLLSSGSGAVRLLLFLLLLSCDASQLRKKKMTGLHLIACIRDDDGDAQVFTVVTLCCCVEVVAAGTT